MHLHHIAIQVSDLKRAADFYGRFLGLQEIRQQPHSRWYDLGGAILMLELCTENPNPPPWKSTATGLHLLALQIASSERLLWKNRLEEAYIPIEGETRYTVYFRDPEGNRLALSHYPNELP